MGFFNKKEAIKEEIIDSAGDEAESEELFAVISAAIAAYEQDLFRQTLNIQKIDRTCGARPAWGAAGTNEAIDARRI